MPCLTVLVIDQRAARVTTYLEFVGNVQTSYMNMFSILDITVSSIIYVQVCNEWIIYFQML